MKALILVLLLTGCTTTLTTAEQRDMLPSTFDKQIAALVAAEKVICDTPVHVAIARYKLEIDRLAYIRLCRPKG
ncbi:MAG: hypothetical protein MJK15_00625 [Colwellia sp.]|nr:hypothetical protein [Colwellia sp.]